MLSVKEAAARLNLSVASIRKRISDGIIKAEKTGRSFQINPDELVKVSPPKDRTFTEDAAYEWNLSSNLKHRVSRLKDDCITKFWNDHCAKLSAEMPLHSIGELVYNRHVGVNHTVSKLEKKQFNNNVNLYVEPHLEYCLSDVKAEIVRIRPCRKLTGLYEQWFSHSTILYNYSIACLRLHYPDKKNMSKFKIRNELLDKYRSLGGRLPNAIAQNTILEARLAYKAGDATFRTGQKSIQFDGRCISDGYIYPTHTKRYFNRYGKRSAVIMESAKLDLKKTDKICRLFCQDDRFYISYPVPVSAPKAPRKEFVSLDPGIRSFMTYYDGESWGEIGPNFIGTLNRLTRRLDNLQSKVERTNSKRKKDSLKRASAKIRTKLKNKVKDLHHKTISILGNYKTVFLPNFKVKQLSATLDAKNTRKLMGLSHFSFKSKLAFKTSENGNRLVICNEAYTSKTCTRCGVINNELGLSKTFNCKSCGLCCDRDYNGARNIALRVLTYGQTHGYCG